MYTGQFPAYLPFCNQAGWITTVHRWNATRILALADICVFEAISNSSEGGKSGVSA
jgi:hypothetical protein